MYEENLRKLKSVGEKIATDAQIGALGKIRVAA